jgi:hypothetical protein
MILNLDPKTRLEIASMVYSRWAAAFDAHKAVKAATWESAGKFCPKAEWPNYHAAQLQNAAQELELAAKLKADICPFSPLVTGEIGCGI